MATATKEFPSYGAEGPTLIIIRRTEEEMVPRIKLANPTDCRLVYLLQDILDERTCSVEIEFNGRIRRFDRHHNMDPEKTASRHIGGFKEKGSLVPPDATIGSLVVVLANGKLRPDDVIVGKVVINEDRTKLRLYKPGPLDKY